MPKDKEDIADQFLLTKKKYKILLGFKRILFGVKKRTYQMILIKKSRNVFRLNFKRI